MEMGFWNRIAELLGIQRQKKVLGPENKRLATKKQKNQDTGYFVEK